MARKLGVRCRKVKLTFSGLSPNGAAMVIKKDGLNTVDTIGTTEQLIVTAFEFISESGGSFTISSGPGGEVCGGKLPATGGGIGNSMVERRCLKGTPPTVTCAAGNQCD